MSAFFQKITAFFASVVLLFSTAVFGAVNYPSEPDDVKYFTPTGETLTLISKGKSDYVIVRGENATPCEKNAAATLSNYLKKISGVTVRVVSDSTSKTDKEIIVGKTNREGNSTFVVGRSTLGTDGYVVRTVGKKLVIAGGETRGTLYGVYDFLEKYLNCRWFTQSLISIPTSSVVEIPEKINYTEKPYLEYRETDWISPRNAEYSIANKLNSNTYRYLSPEQGGVFGYFNGLCHTMTAQIVSASKYFDEHPEYFALGVRSKERTPNQLCLTNEDTIQIAINDVLDVLKRSPEADIISVTQADNQDYCVCPECKKVDDEEGSHAGTMIRFVNRIADAVKEAGYDKVEIDTFAYQYTRHAPKITKPRDNVVIRLCTIECCFSHPLAECPGEASLRTDITNWKNICNKLYVWDYTTNYSNYLGPFPDFGVIQKNMQFFIENKVVGVYEEGNYTASQCNAEFAELRSYLLAKLMWDPYMDMDKAMNEFLEAYYGPGWKSIRQYIDMTIANTGRRTFTGLKHGKIYSAMVDEGVLFLNKNQIKYIDSLWLNAYRSAKTDEQIRNVKLSELSWRYWKGCNAVDEFSRDLPSKTWQNENRKLYEDMTALGITRFNESRMLTSEPDFTLRPSSWGENPDSDR